METEVDVDVVVVGAGFSGLYLLHRLRNAGFTVSVIEAADGVGGTWYWNRYPGARCDITSLNYSYGFDADLDQDWTWSEKYATQPEILEYINHVADRFGLRDGIRFSTRVTSAAWDNDHNRWLVGTSEGDTVRCRHYVMATGCLSVPKSVDIEGADRFAGPTYVTGRWPHEPVDFSGLKVGVIGTGSSAVQSIPLIAKEAAEVVVFQRTPSFAVPAGNRPLSEEEVAEHKANYPEHRRQQRESRIGVPAEIAADSALALSDEELNDRLEAAWARGDLLFPGTFNDVLTNREANDRVAEFVRQKILAVVDDPETAELLCPTTYPLAAKRMCLDTDYFQTFNLGHVSLVDLKSEPITTITETGIDTTERSIDLDVLVLATGFDAMTGALTAFDIIGRDGIVLAEAWADGPRTYVGLTVPGFPNFFTITGPQSPSVLTNMLVSIEQHVEWVTDCITYMKNGGFDTIEPTEEAAAGWVQHNDDFAGLTLLTEADSWYVGANVEGKPRSVMPYVGGLERYGRVLSEIVDRDYLGFRLTGPEHTRVNDGVIRRLKPDIEVGLEIMAQMGLPPIETLGVEGARDFMAVASSMSPPGPEVGEVVDGVYFGADGELDYTLYRPETKGPHPIVLYFHGGGWVLGGAKSDDALCRDLCVRVDAIVVSVDYRHAPESTFPAAVDDAEAALKWLVEHGGELGGDPERIVLCGWSAGGNLAAVVAQTVRDNGGPAIEGQVLITPVTDCDLETASMVENGDGYTLTKSLMGWFWDNYCDPAERSDPRASPIRGDLDGLAPAVVVTAGFDPLRDEGDAYAAALSQAGNEVEHLRFAGQIHTSVGGVDVYPSSVVMREQISDAIRRFHQR